MRACPSIRPELRTSSHELRKHYISMMVAAGVPATALAKWMGHRNNTMINERYGKVMPGAEDQARLLRRAAVAEARDALAQDHERTAGHSADIPAWPERITAGQGYLSVLGPGFT